MSSSYSHIATYRARDAAIELQRATRDAIPDVGGRQDDPLYMAAVAAHDAACSALSAAQRALDADPKWQEEVKASGDWLSGLAG